jgi:hypothetical protein
VSLAVAAIRCRFAKDSGRWVVYFFRHTCESGYPVFSASYWIPASAGMTENKVLALWIKHHSLNLMAVMD